MSEPENVPNSPDRVQGDAATTTTTTQRTTAAAGPTGHETVTRSGWPAAALPVAAVAAAMAALLLALRVGGALVTTIPGLPDPGPVTTWALPLARLLADALATVTVGMLVTAAFLLPGDGPTVSPYGYLLRRRAGLAAAGWAVSALALIVLTVSDLLGFPLDRLGVPTVVSYATAISQGQALLFQAGLAVTAAVIARAGLSRGSAALAATLAVAAVVPPAFTGHAAGAGNHQIAVSSLTLHVLGAALWAGGLAALLMIRRATMLADVAGRYSRLALVCFAAVTVSGGANAAVRLGTPAQLWQSRYGWLILGKLAALLILGGFGAAHRRRTLRQLSAGRRGAFTRLAAGELVVFAAAIGLAVALSRSPTPVPDPGAEADPLTALLGFPMPAAPIPENLLGHPLPDLLLLTASLAGAGTYLVGVWRLRKAGTAGRSPAPRAGSPASWSSPPPPDSASPGTPTCCSAPTWPSTWCWPCWCRSCSSAAPPSPSPCARCAAPPTRRCAAPGSGCWSPCTAR